MTNKSFNDIKDSRTLLSEFKFKSNYAKYNDKLDRLETWEESVDRVFDEMHGVKYEKELANSPKLRKLYEYARTKYKQQYVLGSQRALQFGGAPILKHNAKMFNCLHIDTEFVTTHGVKSFNNYKNGDKVTVLSHKSKWQKATVKKYGKQKLNEIIIKRNNNITKLKATKNHRWYLKDGTISDKLKIGDKLLSSLDIFSKFSYENASPMEKLYWCYGMVYGDGTLVQDKNKELKHSMIRLCGDDSEYENRFKEMGFSTSTPLSCKGDIIAYTGKYLKTSPNPEIDSPELIKAFVRGYLDADGCDESRSSNPFSSIQSSDYEHIEFIRKCFPIAGVFIVSEQDLTDQETNYGKRPYTIAFRILNKFDRENKYAGAFNVIDIIENVEEDDVWCLEVENDKSFTLPNGLITGNCLATYADRTIFFQETMYWLLCGCGVGFSVQKHHVAKLPLIKKRSNRSKVFVVEDSIEGWSDAIGVLLSSYFDTDSPFQKYQGCHISFDYSKIRPRGSLISGGFKAPGHEGLRATILKIEELIEKELSKENFDGEIKPILAYDIVMHMSDAVLSGGVRRSATICLFSHTDEEMLNAKTGNWIETNPQRGRSNNSVLLDKNTITKEEFSKIMESVKHYGEPGFVFTEDYEIMYNPCVTKDTTVLTSKGIKTVDDLINNKFVAIIDGKEYDSTSNGFWKTGTKQVFKVKTVEGYELRLTDNHKLLCVNDNNEEIWKELKDIEISDRIKINNHKNYSWGNVNNSESEIGWLTGNLVGDGTFDDTSAILRYWGNESYLKNTAIKYLTNNFKTYKDFSGSNYINVVSIGSSKFKRYLNDEFGIKNNEKTPSVNLEKQSSKFLEGYIQGLFDADGSVQGNQIKGVSIRLTQNNLLILKQTQRILLRLGINSKIYEGRRAEGWYPLPDGNGGISDFFCKEMHELIISKNNIIAFNDRIGFSEINKQNKLTELINNYKRNPNKENFIVTISNIIEDGVEDVYDVTIDVVHRFDANGIVAHNCVEIGMYPQFKGKSGFQGCNLCEINGGACNTEELFYDACKAAAIIGTLQAGYTDFKYVDEISKKIFDREALLGCSITGFMSNPEILLNPEIQRKGAQIIVETNEIVAKLIGINPAARTTCVKPSGNASVLLKTASGIHGEEAPMYFRNVQVNKDEDMGKYIQELLPSMVEDSVWSASGTDWVVSFPIKTDNKSLYKEDLYGTELLRYVKLTQQNWVEAGTIVERCTIPSVRHNVSNTIVVDNWERVENYIFENKHWFAGVSLLPMTGANDYAQAPFTAVYDPSDIIDKYGDAAMFASGLIVDGLKAFNDNLWKACDTVLGFGEKLDHSEDEVEKIIDKLFPEELWTNLGFKNGTLATLTSLLIKPEVEEYKRYLDSKLVGTVKNYMLKNDWIRRANQFAKRYFVSTKEMTYCLKDVYNYHRWVEIERYIYKLNFDGYNKKPEYVNIDTTGAVSCSGQQCEITF